LIEAVDFIQTTIDGNTRKQNPAPGAIGKRADAPRPTAS